MKYPKRFLLSLVIIVLINICLFLWKKNLDSQIRPQNVSYLNDLPENSIGEISFDPQNRLWVYGKFGIKVFENGSLILSFSNNDINVGYLTNDIQRFYFDHIGQTWFNADNSLYVLSDGHWKVFDKNSLGLQDDYIDKIVFDKESRIWIATRNKKILILSGPQLQEHRTLTVDAEAIYIDDMAVDSSGNIWISTWGNGVTIINGENQKNFTKENSPLLSDFVYKVVFDKTNAAWICTSDGVSILNGTTWKNYNSSNSNLSEGGVDWVYFSKNGRIWLSNEGLVIENMKWKYYFIPLRLFELRWGKTTFDQNGNLWLSDIVNPLDNTIGQITFVPANVRLVSKFEIFLRFITISGGSLFISLLIIEGWFAILIKASKALWVSLAFALVLGSWHFYIMAFEFVGHATISRMQDISQIYFIGNPGFITAILVTAIGLLARIKWKTTKSQIIALVISWIFILPVGYVFSILVTFTLKGP